MILIIDDDSAVRSSLSFMLKRAGYEAQTVPGPREAMDVVRAEAPALILMDMNFSPFHNGRRGVDFAETSENIPAPMYLYPDDGVGKYTTCRAGYAGGRVRLYHEAVEQCRFAATYRDSP